MTIIRAAEALRAAGQTALADELTGLLQRTMADVDQLLKHVHKSQELIKRYINGVQVRCGHKVWHLDPPDSIACCNCGHTVCEPDLHTWGKKVLEKPSFFERAHYQTSRTNHFTLSTEWRKKLGDKLVVKEIEDAEESAEGTATKRESGDATATGSDGGAGREDVPSDQPRVGTT